MLAINAREANLAVRKNLCPLSRRLFFKHGTLPQWMFSLADNTRVESSSGRTSIAFLLAPLIPAPQPP